jgi:hypothetical protein
MCSRIKSNKCVHRWRRRVCGAHVWLFRTEAYYSAMRLTATPAFANLAVARADLKYLEGSGYEKKYEQAGNLNDERERTHSPLAPTQRRAHGRSRLYSGDKVLVCRNGLSNSGLVWTRFVSTTRLQYNPKSLNLSVSPFLDTRLIIPLRNP